MAQHPTTRPSASATSDPRAQARAMFGRVLSAWASDLLKLRRQGMDRPGYRRGTWAIAGQLGPSSSTAAEAA